MSHAARLPVGRNAQSAIATTDESSTTSQPAWMIWGTAAALLFLSFLCEQNVRISTQFAYTQTLDEMTSTAEGGNFIRRLMFLAFGCGGGVLFLASLKRRWSVDPLLALALILVPFWCCASLLWSIDFGMSARRLIVMLCCAVGAAGIGRTFSLRELIKIAFLVTLATALLGIAAEIVYGTFRPWSGGYRFSGTLHPNTQGMFLGLLALSAFTLSRLDLRHRGWYLACCGLGLGLLVLTKSRTATAAVMLALGSLWLMQTNWRWPVVFGSAVAWCGGVAAILFLSLGLDAQEELQSALLLGRKEQTESFTGRGEIWPVVLSFIEKSPYVGHGFETFWTPAHIAYVSDTVEWPVREAHNGYLEVLLHLGGIGLMLLLALVGWAGVRVLYEYSRSSDACYPFIGSLLVFGLIDSTMESGMVTPQTVTWMIAAFLMHLATCDARQTSGLIANPPRQLPIDTGRRQPCYAYVRKR